MSGSVTVAVSPSRSASDSAMRLFTAIYNLFGDDGGAIDCTDNIQLEALDGVVATCTGWPDANAGAISVKLSPPKPARANIKSTRCTNDPLVTYPVAPARAQIQPKEKTDTRTPKMS